MERTTIEDLYKNAELVGKSVTVAGWVRTIRDSKSVGFLQINDGSYLAGIQVVLEEQTLSNYEEIVRQNVGASLVVTGELVLTPQAKQSREILAHTVQVEGGSTPDYPLQKKRHSVEYLRTIAHLRPRTNLLLAVNRIRSEAAQAIHSYFYSQGFSYVHTPIITGSDCEGAGEMFTVTSLDLDALPKTEQGTVDFHEDFFGQKTSLTVSGQLEGECMAMALGKIYTFGPTFRAERSNTQRHAAEFWMIEPEFAFGDLQDDMDLAEDMLKFVVGWILTRCKEEVAFLDKFISTGLEDRLWQVKESEFGHITYTEAVKLLEKNAGQFEYPVSWGMDLQTEHERYLTEQIFQKPVFVTDYPKEIKSFYMRLNGDGKTVAAMDLLVPGIGEMIGGSQREERLDYLQKRMQELGLEESQYQWYLDLRRYGSVKHAGFGLGFERLVMYLTGVTNIRDVLPFPRTTGHAGF